jgi:flagellar basal body-associated protein FliL
MIIPTKKFKDVQTSLGKDSLRNEIIAQLNPLLDKGEITNLYFQEFVVQ